ncbi:NUDIX hydrolase domain-like protein, partial [Zopfochytrium polystomum]
HIKWKYKSVPPRQACVLLPLCHVAGRASVLFTVRSSQLRNHAGEVSFPGGKRDPTDPSLAHAALRETEEEIGVTAVRLLGKLTPLPDKSLTTEVHPFVGWDVPGDLDVRSLILNHSEVEYAFTMALEELLDPAARSYERFREMTHVLAPYWRGPMEERIWG